MKKFNLILTKTGIQCKHHAHHQGPANKHVKPFGHKQGSISEKGKMNDNKEQFEIYEQEIKTLQKFRNRFELINSGKEILGNGIFTKKWLNAFKS